MFLSEWNFNCSIQLPIFFFFQKIFHSFFNLRKWASTLFSRYIVIDFPYSSVKKHCMIVLSYSLFQMKISKLCKLADIQYVVRIAIFSSHNQRVYITFGYNVQRLENFYYRLVKRRITFFYLCTRINTQIYFKINLILIWRFDDL